MQDRPFAAPLDIELDLPVPPSVNKTRKVDWNGDARVKKWVKHADGEVTVSGQYRAAKSKAITGPYELTVILSESLCKSDPDNLMKVPIDYLRRLNLITDDSPKFARRIIVEWGHAPKGIRLILRPREPN